MEWFDQMTTLGHERVLLCSAPDVGLRAIIAVHSTLLGPGLGGVRMWPFASDEEAMTDVLRLSRGMTYKAAVAGVNLGGGKAVILGDPKTEKTETLFRTFGRYVESLGGAYITAEDVGTSPREMEWIHSETRWVSGVSPDLGGSGDPSPVTAFGVWQGLRAAAQWRWNDTSLRGRSVAIQGLGSVGSHLARFLKDEGAKLFGCDLDPARLETARTEMGVEIVSPEEIYDVEADVFAPCALGASLNDRTIGRLRCAIVAGAANNQLADERRDRDAIEARGILYAPDFVVNAGGLINVYNELIGYDRERAMRMARGVFDNTLQVFHIAREQKVSTAEAADRLAESRLEAYRKMRPRHWDRAIARHT